LWQQKPEFDKLGCKLVCVLIENLPDQVEEFKKDFWPGDLYLDTDKAFFAAVGGGKPMELSVTSLLNPWGKPMKNASRSSKVIKNSNFKGHGTTAGGLFVVSEKAGVTYAFVEKNFGDHAPHDEILEGVRKAAA